MLSATSEVEITVNNVDDNSPQFSGTLYQYTILENTGAALHEADDGTEIVTVGYHLCQMRNKSMLCVCAGD